MKLYASFLLLCFTIPSAYAYIDPGSGSFMLQMLIASLIGASFTIKAYFKTIKEKIKTLFGKPSEEPMQNSENQDTHSNS